MRKAENKNTPNLEGFAIGAAAGLVAFGVLVIVGKFDLFPAAFLGAGIAAVAGLFLGMPWGSGAPAPMARPQITEPDEAAPVRVAAAPVAAEPVRAAAPAAKAEVAEVTAEPMPVAMPAAAPSAGPARLSGPRGKADDLKEIEGIGPALEKLVNSLGFYHYDQIASWSDADVAVVDAEMKNFKGRITRDKWVAQAKLIVAEGLEAFRERAKTNNY
jgi:predicted flap endonuclease-1-like 5' DNA nuclease